MSSVFVGSRGKFRWTARAFTLVAGVLLFSATAPVRSSSISDPGAAATFTLGKAPVPHGALGGLRTLSSTGAAVLPAKAAACQPAHASLAMLKSARAAVAIAEPALVDANERIFYDGFTGPGACLTELDCPTSLVECVERACVAGQCEQPASPTGSACSSGVCTATGACVACNLNTDCAPTGLECAPAFCVANVCVQTPLPPEIPCSEGVCDGTGACVGCLNGGDCPPTGSQCVLAACVTQVCMQQPAPFGTICDIGICNGFGICVTP